MIELAQPPMIVPAKPAIITAAERWESSAQRAMERAGLPRHVRRAVVAELRRLCGVRAKFIGPSVDDLSRYAGMNLAGLPGFPSVVAAAGKKSGGNDEFTVLLLHCNGTDGSTTFVDSSASGHTVTAGGDAQIDTAQSKFGGASAKFDGTGDYLLLDGSSDFAFGAGDFTIDFWLRLAAVGVFHYLTDFRPSVGGSPYPALYVNTDNTIRFFDGTDDRIVGVTTLSADTWYHVALARGSGSTKLFIDGTQTGSTYSDSNSYGVGANRPTIGIHSSLTSTMLNGWLDEFRISKGIARWTSNFTPPNQAYS